MSRYQRATYSLAWIVTVAACFLGVVFAGTCGW